MLSWEQRKVVRVTFSSPSCQPPGRVLALSAGDHRTSYRDAVGGRLQPNIAKDRRQQEGQRAPWLVPSRRQMGTYLGSAHGIPAPVGSLDQSPLELRFYNPIALSPFEVKTKPMREWSPGGHVKVTASAPRVFSLELRAAEGLERNPPLEAHPACGG